jgi:hypothetical protein
MIFLKIFFGVWFARKNYEMQKSEVANVAGIRQRPVAVVGFRRERLTGSGRNLPDPPNQGSD